MAIDVKVKRLSPNAVSLKYQREGDAGFDLSAIEDVFLHPGETKAIRTGWAFGLPKGYELQIRARSGLSLNTKLRISNSIGTIDENYVGEVLVLMDNIGKFPATIQAGTRIAQGVLKEQPIAIFHEVDTLDDTERGTQGFGSSGS